MLRAFDRNVCYCDIDSLTNLRSAFDLGRRHDFKSEGGQNVIRERNGRKKFIVPPTFGKVGVQSFFPRAGNEQANNYQY